MPFHCMVCAACQAASPPRAWTFRSTICAALMDGKDGAGIAATGLGAMALLGWTAPNAPSVTAHGTAARARVLSRALVAIRSLTPRIQTADKRAVLTGGPRTGQKSIRLD